MELSSLLSGSDNLYKTLFIGGLTMIIFSLVYPIQQQQEIEIEKNSLQKEVSLLSLQLENLGLKLDKLESKTQKTKDTLNSLSRLITIENKDSILTVKNVIKKSYSDELQTIKDIQHKSEKDVLTNEFEKLKIDILEKYLSKYKNFTFAFILFGIVALIIGSIGWYKTTKLNSDLKKKELGIYNQN